MEDLVPECRLLTEVESVGSFWERNSDDVCTYYTYLCVSCMSVGSVALCFTV